MKEVDGYTQEEFEAMLKMMRMHGVYAIAVANGWSKPPMTPQKRMELINQYRENANTPAYFFTQGYEGKYGDKRGDE